jgi:P27 family predicted phage terminase small subunit
MRGRKPKPTELKIVQGTFTAGDNRKRAREPKLSKNLDAAPDWLTPSQKESWDYAIENSPSGLLKRLDRSVLTAWVIAEDNHRFASQQLQTQGMVFTSPNGHEVQSPYVGILNTQAQMMMKCASEMGFTPTSRSRIVLAEEEVEDDPWAKLANG